MKAVNLIPADSRRGGGLSSGLSLGPAHAVLALLIVAVGLVTFYVLTGDTISSRQAQIRSMQADMAQYQTQATQLNRYVKFAQLAQQRAATVRQIASTRFDWQRALSDLSKVVPANTSLQSLVATDSPTDNVASGSGGGASGGTAGTFRTANAGPAFEINGCTGTQDDVARLISRLRLIGGVTRVVLGSTQKQEAAQGGSSVSAASAASSAAASGQGCAANSPSFSLDVFFAGSPQAALPSAAANGTAGGAAPVSTASGAAAAPSTTTGGSR